MLNKTGKPQMRRKVSGTNRIKLAAAYAVMVVVVYLVFLLTSSFLSWIVLFLLTLPFSVVTGLVSAATSHSGYYLPPELASLLAAVANCLCLIFLGNRPLGEEEGPTDN